MPNLDYYEMLDEYKQMVGRRFGRLTVIEYLGTIRGNGPTFLCLCDSGDEFRARCKDVCDGSRKACRYCSGGENRKKEQLCWNCRHATSYLECSWAAGIPRTDWTATETFVTGDKSFFVSACPGFEPDERR